MCLGHLPASRACPGWTWRNWPKSVRVCSPLAPLRPLLPYEGSRAGSARPPQCHLTVAHVLAEGSFQIRPHGGSGRREFWRDTVHPVHLWTEVYPDLQFEVPLLVQLKRFLKDPPFVVHEGAAPSKTQPGKTARSPPAQRGRQRRPSALPRLPPAAGSASFRKGPGQNSELGDRVQVHTLLPVSSVTLGKSFPFSEPQFPFLSVWRPISSPRVSFFLFHSAAH